MSLDSAEDYQRALVEAATECAVTAPMAAGLDAELVRRVVRLEAERAPDDQDLVNMNLTYCIASAGGGAPSGDPAGQADGVDAGLTARLRECAMAMSPGDAGDLAGDEAMVAAMLGMLAPEIRPAAVDAFCADSRAAQQ